ILRRDDPLGGNPGRVPHPHRWTEGVEDFHRVHASPGASAPAPPSARDQSVVAHVAIPGTPHPCQPGASAAAPARRLDYKGVAIGRTWRYPEGSVRVDLWPCPRHSPYPPASSLDLRNTPIHVDASTPASTPRRHAEFSRTRKNGGWRIGRNRAGPVRRDDTHPSRGPASSG